MIYGLRMLKHALCTLRLLCRKVSNKLKVCTEKVCAMHGIKFSHRLSSLTLLHGHLCAQNVYVSTDFSKLNIVEKVSVSLNCRSLLIIASMNVDQSRVMGILNQIKTGQFNGTHIRHGIVQIYHRMIIIMYTVY